MWSGGIGVGVNAQFNITAITGNRTYILPNLDGTLVVRGTGINITNRTTSVGTSNILASAIAGVYLVDAVLRCTTVGDAGDNVQLNVIWNASGGAISVTANGTTTLTRATGSFITDGVAVGDAVTGTGVPVSTTVATVAATSLTCNNAITAGTEPASRTFTDSHSYPLLSLPLDVARGVTQGTLAIRLNATSNIQYSTTLTSPGAGTPAHSIHVRTTSI
jgi:hypothetical protein